MLLRSKIVYQRCLITTLLVFAFVSLAPTDHNAGMSLREVVAGCQSINAENEEWDSLVSALRALDAVLAGGELQCRELQPWFAEDRADVTTIWFKPIHGASQPARDDTGGQVMQFERKKEQSPVLTASIDELPHEIRSKGSPWSRRKFFVFSAYYEIKCHGRDVMQPLDPNRVSLGEVEAMVHARPADDMYSRLRIRLTDGRSVLEACGMLTDWAPVVVDEGKEHSSDTHTTKEAESDR